MKHLYNEQFSGAHTHIKNKTHSNALKYTAQDGMGFDGLPQSIRIF